MGWAKYFEDNMEIVCERHAAMQTRIQDTRVNMVCTGIHPIAKLLVEAIKEDAVSVVQEEYVDRYIICRDCGRKFLFTAKAQKHYDKMEWNDPVRCKNCRDFRNIRFLMRAYY